MTQKFLDMHRPGAPFVLANVWDIGSARVMAALGAKALATSSAAHAYTLGRPDGGTLDRSEALDHAAQIAQATTLPVQGDFENGFGDSPDTCAETVRLAGQAGLAGVCIEDIALPSSDAYPFDHAVDRIRAAAEAAQTAGVTLTARADGIMTGAYDLAEAIRRCQAFHQAGAHVLYAPLPAAWDDLATLVRETPGPVNALMAGDYTSRPLTDFAAIGVARVSLGSTLARITHQALLDSGRAILAGDFPDIAAPANGGEVDALLA